MLGKYIQKTLCQFKYYIFFAFAVG